LGARPAEGGGIVTQVTVFPGAGAGVKKRYSSSGFLREGTRKKKRGKRSAGRGEKKWVRVFGAGGLEWFKWCVCFLGVLVRGVKWCGEEWGGVWLAASVDDAFFEGF